MSKSDKYMGVDAPIVRRRTDPAPPKPTPKASERKITKPYGYSWIWGHFNKKKKRSYAWFKTETARDQSYDAILAKKVAFEKAIGKPGYSICSIRKEPNTTEGAG